MEALNGNGCFFWISPSGHKEFCLCPIVQLSGFLRSFLSTIFKKKTVQTVFAGKVVNSSCDLEILVNRFRTWCSWGNMPTKKLQKHPFCLREPGFCTEQRIALMVRSKQSFSPFSCFNLNFENQSYTLAVQLALRWVSSQN